MRSRSAPVLFDTRPASAGFFNGRQSPKKDRLLINSRQCGKKDRRRLKTGKARRRIARGINGICGRVQETDTPDFSDRNFSHLSRFIMEILSLTVFPVSGCS